MSIDVPTFTYTPDTCSMHGPIGEHVSVVQHLREVHGLTHEQYLVLEELAAHPAPDERQAGLRRNEYDRAYLDGMAACRSSHPMTDERQVGLREDPCTFVPAHEPWSCAVHRGGFRTSLDTERCNLATPPESIVANGRLYILSDLAGKFADLAEQPRAALAVAQVPAPEDVEPWNCVDCGIALEPGTPPICEECVES